MRLLLLGLLVAGALLAGCGDSTDSTTASDGAAPAGQDTTAAPGTGGDTASSEDSAAGDASGGTKYPDIKKAVLEPAGGGYTLSVTVSSPYDSPDRYADGWRVLNAGTDEVLGMHTLGHDHASEQPFTREQSDLQIPDGVQRITIEGRDQQNGYGGRTVTIDVPQ